MRLVSVLYDNHHPWDVFFPLAECVCLSNPKDLREKDILILHGGGDISPKLYNKAPSKYTMADGELSRRDSIEWSMLQRAVELRCAIIGICRGGQMLCAAAGGFLVQHVDKHGGNHAVETYDGEVITVNSIHHQMMAPWNTNHKLLGWAAPSRSGVYHSTDEDGKDVLIDMPCEPELVYFPDIKGMAIQWHPEMMASQAAATKYIIKELQHAVV